METGITLAGTWKVWLWQARNTCVGQAAFGPQKEHTVKAIRILQALACVAVVGSYFVLADRVEARSDVVRIISVTCVKATEGSDSDEIYFSFSNGKRFPGEPRDIRNGEKWRIDHLVGFRSDLIIKLIEADTIGDDDLIGAVAISSNDAPGIRTELMTGDSSRYVVVLEIK